MFEDLDNNFKKNAAKPIQTDVKKMDTAETSYNDEPKEYYEKNFENSQMSGLLSIFDEKLKSRLKKSEEKKESNEDYDTINFSEKNVVIKSNTAPKEVTEDQISSLLQSNLSESSVKIVSSSEKNKVEVKSTPPSEFSSAPTTTPYEATVQSVDPNHNIKIFKDTNTATPRYETTQTLVDPSSNLQSMNYSGATGLSQAIGQGTDSHRISDDEIAMHLAKHNQKKEEESEEDRLNSVVEVPEHLKT
jgi:hypothetical protein